MRVDDEIKYQIGLTLIDGIGKYLINSILSTDALTRAEQELKWIEQEGINHLFYADYRVSNAFEAM